MQERMRGVHQQKIAERRASQSESEEQKRHWVSRLIRPNKKLRVFRVIGLQILGRVGTHIFVSRRKYNFMHFERHFAFQNS